ncbi:MAG: hypothetical protein JXB49_05995 [Bacteroidales bacterium]|nr:hypothetical protein [Bacteroidales bacterium]
MRKITVEECERISISTIIWKQVYQVLKLEPDASRTRLNAIIAQRLDNMEYYSILYGDVLKNLKFITSRPHYGGVRYWFVCPECKRRAGTLYRPPGASCFKCRHCHNLTYSSSQVHDSRLADVLSIIKGGVNYDVLDSYLRNKRKLRGKIIDKGMFQWPSPRTVRNWKEDSTYNKYVKPLLER